VTVRAGAFQVGQPVTIGGVVSGSPTAVEDDRMAVDRYSTLEHEDVEALRLASRSTTSRLVFRVRLPADALGSYSVCFARVARDGDGKSNFILARLSTIKAGELHVTTNVDVGRQYLVDPRDGQSVEVTGSSLRTTDRLTVLNCSSHCGDTGALITLAPVTGAASPATHSVTMHPYTTVSSRYCFAGNLDGPAEHRCYHKCVGGGAGCSGYNRGADSEGSQALCVDADTCRTLCSADEACWGIDVHGSTDRCYLNSAACAVQVSEGTLGVDPAYSLLIKDSLEYTLTGVPAGVDMGFSTATKLRFAPLQLPGGRYKVCFCDSAATGGDCSTADNFQVEVGELVVTGVMPAVKRESLRSSRCEEQWHGGLSCGGYSVTQPSLRASAAPGALDAFGAVGPEVSTPLVVEYKALSPVADAVQ